MEDVCTVEVVTGTVVRGSGSYGPGQRIGGITSAEARELLRVGVVRLVSAPTLAPVPERTELPRDGTESAPAVHRRTNINTATAPELAVVLNGVGAEIAQRIIDSRETVGPFPSVDALRRVRGIGPAIIARHRHQLTTEHP